MFNTVFPTAVQWSSPHTNDSCLPAFSRHTSLIYYRTPICDSWFGSAEKSQPQDCMFKQCTISCTVRGAKSAIIILFPPLVSLANIHIQVHKPNVCLVRVMGSHESCTWPFHMCSATVHTQVTCLLVMSWERDNMPWLDKHTTRQLLLLVSHLLKAGKWTVFQDAHECSISTTCDLSTNDNCLKYTSDTWILLSQGQHLGPSTPPRLQFYSSPSMVGSEPKCIPLLSCRLLYTLQGRREDLRTGCILMSY
jgi:hypothetical protein